MTHRTTVVIATRNRVGELCRTLAHLLELRPAPSVIVVDNGSADDTAATVRTVHAQHPQVGLIRLNRNDGAAARNVGVSAACTPYVAFSDDDSWWAPGALERAQDVLDRHPSVGLVAAKTIVEPSGEVDPTSHLMADSPLGAEPGLPGPEVLGFLACSAVVRRSAYLEAGGFSTLLHFAGEEKLLSYDLAARGWALCYRDDVVAHHQPSRTRSDPARRRAQERRNEALISWMRRPVRHGLRTAASLAAASASEPAAARAAGGALLRLPRALRQRSRLPDRVERQARILEFAHGR